MRSTLAFAGFLIASLSARVALADVVPEPVDAYELGRATGHLVGTCCCLGVGPLSAIAIVAGILWMQRRKSS
ncbi:MAG: hypothetical protein KC619_26650 [Myxococcales bacterium]|nr:hypothetical protein [Myxococcales bacterium]